MAPTLTPTKLRTRIWGNFSLRKDGYIMAVVAGVDHSHGDFVTVMDTLVSAYMNIEVFGLQKGFYIAQACPWVKTFYGSETVVPHRFPNVVRFL